MSTTRALVWAVVLCAAPALAQSQQPPTSPGMPQQQGTGGSGAQTAPAATFRTKAPQTVVRAIEERTREWEQAFNRHDVDTMAAFFTPDATLLTADGQASEGREDIERQLRRDHTGPMRAARASATVRSVRALSPTLVIADLEYRVEGAQLPAGSATGGAGSAGAMNSHVTLTATKQGNTWKVVALRAFPAPGSMQQGVGGAGMEGSEGTQTPASSPSPSGSEDATMPSDPMTTPSGQPPQGEERPTPQPDER